jgi:hypothetical protein
VQAAGRILAATTAEGGAAAPERWRVMVAEFGADKNGTPFDKKVLAAHLDKFEGARVFCVAEAQHKDPKTRHPMGKSVRELVGWLENVTATETGIEADLVFLSSASWLSGDIADALEKGKKDLLGLSVDMAVRGTKKKGPGGREIVTATQVVKVEVDVVYEPAAGGRFLQVAAAIAGPNEEEAMLDRLLATLRATRPDLYRQIEARVTAGTVTEDEVLAQIQAAVRDPVGAPDLTAQITTIVTQVLAATKPGASAEESKVLQETRVLACKLQLRDELGASQLPDPVKTKLAKQYDGKVFELADVQAAITAEKEVLDQLTASGVVTGSGDVRVTGDDLDARKTMLKDFFDGKVHSIKACYQHITGDTAMTGKVRDARILASLDRTSWAEVFGDVMHNRLIAEYNASGLGDWRKLVNIVPVADFELRHFTVYGGYGDLPAVAEAGPYTALTSPADTGGSYQATKRGGTEDLTWEMLLGDKVGAVRRLPQKLGRAASRTLYNFVFAFLRSNAAIYDTVALFHLASHANLLTAALAADGVALKAARLQMLKQKEAGSLEPLGIPPRYIVVPPDLQDIAYALTVQPNVGGFTPTAADALKDQVWEVITDKLATDTNNWFLAADPRDIPGIEVGFLNGNEEPELFVQDMPNVGSMFSNDKLTYKIRHPYGGAVTDFRGFQGNIVA